VLLSDGGGGGARTLPAPTPTVGIAWPRPPTYYKRMFQVFQMFCRYVSCRCCKSRLECYICCNGYIRMLQVSVPNVSSIFFIRMLQVYLSGCCIYFTHKLEVFYLDVAQGRLHRLGAPVRNANGGHLMNG
jgi:hypothetical protein